jgi:diguanylate cyclase (GGDEF)-like protein
MGDEHLREKLDAIERELQESRAHEKVLGDLLEKKLNEIYVLYHISRTIGSVLDLYDMLVQVIDIIQKSLPVERISVYLVDEERKDLELFFYNGLDLARKTVLRVGEGAPGRVAEQGEHIHLHDLSPFYQTSNDFIHHPGEEQREGSYIGIALKARSTTIGVIGMDNRSKYGLSVEDMDFMAILSHQLAAGIERSRLFEKTQQLSQYDGLSGLYNHRMFKEKLAQEINRSGRNQKPLSLMMIDIDHFKQFNDDYGHQAGDMIIKELSSIIRSQTRCNTIDSCCRYGGEEFAVIMPELELDIACKVAARLRRAVEESKFVVGHAHLESKVTISLGVACMTETVGGSAEELVKKADDALYRAKRNGRNRVGCGPDA